MNAKEYLEAAQNVLKAPNDNKLGVALGLENNRVSDYKKGHRRPDEYACTRIAVALGVDPALVIADIALEWEKNEKKREFWLNFRSRAASLNAITVGLSLCALWLHAPDIHAMTLASDTKTKEISYISVHYAKL
jgi:transcriptional regulator with XRE-family HTH domain